MLTSVAKQREKGEELRKLESFQNRSDDSIDVRHDVVIPESEDAVSLRYKIFGTLCVPLFMLQVRASIQFDYKMVTRRTEVGHIRANGMLPAEHNAV
jgi:hypothetical protein